MATRKLDLYKLGVVLDVDGARGLSTLSKTDKELKSVDHNARRAEGSLGRVANGLNRVSSALRGNASGAGGGSFLPGLAHISQIIQGLPQIGQLAHALVSPLTDAAQAGVQFNDFLETTEVGLKKTFFKGNLAQARAFLTDIRGFAAATPFRTEPLIKTVQYMGAVSFQAGEVKGVLTDVGDAIAATGDLSEEAVQSVVRAFGKIRSEGRVSAESMEMLTDANIPAWEMLAHAIGKTVAETRKLSETGRLNGPAAVAAIRAEMRARYGGTMKEMEGTGSGLKSAAADNIQAAQAKATESLTKDINRTLAAALQNGNLTNELAGTINSAIAPVSGMIRLAAVGLLGGGVTSGLREGINAGKTLVTQTVGDFALDAVISPFKSILGINSPSKVFAEFGGFAVEGFAFGQGGRGGIASEESKRKLREALEALLNDPRVRAMLDTIGHAEGADYRTKVGGGDQGSLSRKNRTRVWIPSINDYSTASGRYQFINKTWDSTAGALGLTDFSPRSQDLAAIYQLMKARGHDRRGPSALQELLNGNFSGAVSAAAPVWASFPGAGYGQGERALSKLQRYYSSSLNALNGGMASGGAGVSFSAGDTVPVRVTNAQELIGFKPPAGAIQLTKSPVYENGRIIGYDAAESSPARTSAPGLPEGTLKTFNNFLAIMPPLAAALPITAQKTNEALKDSEVAVGSFAKSVIMSSRDLKGAFSQIAGLMPQQQVGRKRGFFSKLLGAAAPFLGFIPGVGPLLSTLATIGSSALGGDWGGALMGAAGGFASGGAFRRAPSAATPALVTDRTINNNLSGVRAQGGPVSRGRAYLVGEHRAEVFTPDEDGFVHPSLDAFSRKVRDGAQAHKGGIGGMAFKVMQRQLEVMEQLHGRISSMRPGDVLTAGAKENPGAIGDGLMRAGTRDPRVVEWMQRRTA